MIIAPTTEPVLGLLRQLEVDEPSWEELSSCPVCDRSDHLQDLAVIEANSPGAVIAACLDCEHLFKRRRPSSGWLEDYYSHDWDAAGQSRLENRAPVGPRRKILAFCAEYLSGPAKVLDMGAGFGKDLLAFRDAGHAVYALETSTHRAEYLSEVLGIPCVAAPFEVAELPDDLNLIVSHHVLEHVVDPAAALARASAALPDGGLLYIAVPNCLSFEHAFQLLHYAPHQSGFSLKSLTRLLAAHGFEVVKAKATREVKLLARKTRSEPAPAAAVSAGVNADFREAAERWVAEGFGRRPGSRTLVWWRGGGKGINRCYESAMLPGGQRVYRSIQAVRRAYSRAPTATRRLDRLVPVLSKPDVRMLHVRASGPFELPVTVQYTDSSPPIWVK